MELKEGYKQTEVGIIPNDWKTINIARASKLINGRGFKPHEWQKNGLPIIRIQNLNGTKDYNYYSGSYDKKIEVEAGQLLFAWSGSKGTSFGPHVWQYETGLLNYHTWKVVINQEEIEKDFYLHALKQLTKFIENQAHGASALVHVQKWEMEKFYFPIPPTKNEQAAIANSLNVTDDLIIKLEKLLEKKKAIKLGALQQLLKPKEGWKNKKLGEIGLITGAGVDKKIKKNETLVRLLNYMDVFRHDFIYSNELNQLVTAPATKIRQCAVMKGDIFFTPSSEMRYDIALSAVSIEDINDAVYSYHLVRLRIHEDWDLLFKAYIFKTKYFLDQAAEICEGSGKRYVISLPKFRDMMIFYPPKKEEQRQIATILYGMDSEIKSLKEQLGKYKMLKQGMMQELLTGKIRLI